MDIFKLPDLGEGLPDAEIHEWYVKEGDTVLAFQPLASMETAKAVVDVPCPQSGVIKKLFGQPGDIIKTGEPFVGFETAASEQQDKGTVVGNLEESAEVSEDFFIIGSGNEHASGKTTPSVRFLAKKLGVDLNQITGSGEHGIITREDVEKIAEQQAQPPAGYIPLRGVRRAMLNSMIQANQEVVPVSIFDEANLASWSEKTDITVRIIRAICHACEVEPALNAWFDGKHHARKCFDSVHLGLAMDQDEGLFVPVIHNANTQTDQALRVIIDEYKRAVHERTIATDKLKGATITLSNFGKFSGRFASPIIVPPMVAIVAVGRLYEGVISAEGQIKTARLLPISLSFDHRAVTGGEATRFLGEVIKALA